MNVFASAFFRWNARGVIAKWKQTHGISDLDIFITKLSEKVVHSRGIEFNLFVRDVLIAKSGGGGELHVWFDWGGRLLKSVVKNGATADRLLAAIKEDPFDAHLALYGDVALHFLEEWVFSHYSREEIDYMERKSL